MPSYILFDAARRELRLKCALCRKVVLLSTSARLTSAQTILPDPALVIQQHYSERGLMHGACERWFGESQDFYVKDLTRTLRTRKFSWPDSDDDEGYEYYIRCTLCGSEEGYSGPTEVGHDAFCEICEHPLSQHEIIVAAVFADPNTGEFDIPRFT